MKVKETAAGPTLTWLGQAGFLLETGRRRLLIDPWLSPHEARLVEPAPFELVSEEIDWVLVTHEHEDHLDLPFLRRLAQHSPGAQLILPAPIAAAARGVLECRPVIPGERFDLDGLEVAVTASWHCVVPADGYDHHGGRFLGYVIAGAGPTIYHAGDTIANEALAAALAPERVDLALLPTNGRDAQREAREIAGNLDAREAVELAARIGASTLVPYHWDAVAGNTADPGAAAEAAAALRAPLHVLLLAHLLPHRLA